MSVSLISVTPDAESHMAYCARVSNPQNQKNEKIQKLLKYCIDNKHWSVFESSYMTLSICTTVMVSRQIIRHRSFTFQEFSQRYSDVSIFDNFPEVSLRRQDLKNKQNSIDDLNESKNSYYQERIKNLFMVISSLYRDMLDDGVAKECARAILPMATPTMLYMTGNCRQWIHYIQLRCSNGTQLEHRKIAEECKTEFIRAFPTVADSLNWSCDS